MKMFTKDLEVVTASSYLKMFYNKTGAIIGASTFHTYPLSQP